MIRRINYTGRKRLYQEDTRILLTEHEGEVAAFDANLNLKKYELPHDASIFVEAYQQTSIMRFDFGVVGNIRPPEDRRLTQFDSVEGVKFRVKITSTSSTKGKLLAEGNRIRFQRSEEQPDERISLLQVKPQELGDEIAKIDFTDDEPFLLVNLSAGDWRAIAQSSVFKALVYPQALREILSRILVIEKYSDTEDIDDWKSKWLRFATSLPGVSEPPVVGDDDNDDYIWDWIDAVVAAFSKKNQMMTLFQEYWKEECQR